MVDTSVLLAVITEEPTKARLITLTRDADLLAPASVYWEVGNAFSAMFKRKKATLRQAREALEIYRSIPLRLINVDLIDALDIAHTHNIYAYDAYVLVCASKMHAPVLSLDRKLVTTAKSMSLDVLEVPT